MLPLNESQGWGGSKSKIRRPIDSVSLPYGVMDSILADVRDFMDTEDWYTQAGIPHHRGYGIIHAQALSLTVIRPDICCTAHPVQANVSDPSL
jgi:hypothetical protein